jgi:glucan 1,3-beta-glucosidase
MTYSLRSFFSGDTNARSWFTNSTSLTRTLQAISILTAEFTSPTLYGSTVIAIQLINEPFPYTPSELEALRGYYKQGYDTVRKMSGVPVVISDGFKGVGEWESFMPSERYDAVVMDVVSRRTS